MENNQNDSLIQVERLSSNNDYYNVVFKKTERIASAVFYILSYIPVNETNKLHHTHLSDKAMHLHEAVSRSLSFYTYEASDRLFDLKQALVVLESALTLASAARMITNDHVGSIASEIDVVLRYIRNHYSDEGTLGLNSAHRTTALSGKKEETATPRRRRPRSVIPKNDFSSDAVLVYSDISDRTTRIKTVLEAKPEATIKDLSEIITDVSTKTIQRDLNSLIESGEVVREGERRWSKYSLVK